MAKVSRQKLKILYLAKLFLEQTDETHALSIPELIDRLSLCGVMAERKSLYADVEALRQFGFDILTVRTKTTGYYLASRTFDLPEVKILVDLVQSSKFITGKKSTELIHKLEHLTSTHEAQLLQRQVYLPGRIKSMNESIYYSVDAIHRAIAQNCQISFAYFSYTLTKERSYRRSGQPYQISPWALTWDDENYYLIGYESEAGILKHFRVDKMARLSLTDKKRDGADLFRSKDMGIYSKKLFSMFGGEEEIVKLQFPNTLVGVVLDRFGKDTVLTAVDDEHFQISERIIVSTQFFGWLAGLDHKATIIAPESVQDAYRAHLRSLLG
ncbi:MAG: WYL domain-containing protein [Oscillibacter sp.]|nr:WYL domain-containing protein [Oscillibacter sp.]MEA4993285.1 WYL domain-containing protein [Oscillibacter sp.]